MRVKAATLKTLAGGVWLTVGLGLATVGARFVFGLNEDHREHTVQEIWVALILGGLLGILKGHYVLSHTAQRNIKRIARLDDPRIWQVFSGFFALLILAMMGLGRGLRALAAEGYLGGSLGVGALYLGIGCALVVASFAYFVRPPAPLPTRVDSLPPLQPAKDGLLLVNLGSPAAPTPRAVRAFLRQFLSDPRVVEANRLVWAFVLNVIILPFRCRASARLYRSIWTAQGSPLIVHGRNLRDALAERLGSGIPVALGMRYGEPSLEQGLGQLRQQGCTRVLVAPLFAQYSNTTTGSIIAEVTRLALDQRDPMDLVFLPPHFADPLYINALATVAEEQPPADFTVFSFHGIPEAYASAGDPYLEQCRQTAWLLAQRLGLARDQWEMVFQSQFGSEPWLQPYLDEFVPSIARKYPRLRVIAPSFAADCLETLEEISVRLREDFERAGGEQLIVVPALNTHEAWVAALEELVLRLNRAH